MLNVTQNAIDEHNLNDSISNKEWLTKDDWYFIFRTQQNFGL